MSNFGGLLIIPSLIMLARKGLPGTNSLAYFSLTLVTNIKSLIALTPGANVINLFMTVIDYFYT